MIVLDASATIELLLGTPRGAEIAARVSSSAEVLHAPELLDLEVAQVLRRQEMGKLMSAARAQEAMDDYLALSIRRHAHGLLLARIWELRPNVTAYDAAYLALAEALSAPLLTTDARLASVPRCRATVEVVVTARRH